MGFILLAASARVVVWPGALSGNELFFLIWAISIAIVLLGKGTK
jgi:hypothetical protein